MIRRTPALLALSLCLLTSGCSSFLSATRDKPIEDDRGTRTIGSTLDDSLIETKVAVNVAKADTGNREERSVVGVVRSHKDSLVASFGRRLGVAVEVELIHPLLRIEECALGALNLISEPELATGSDPTCFNTAHRPDR